MCRQRSKKLAHLSLKHISLLGVVRQKLKPSKKSQKKKKKKNTERVNEFILDQAAVDEVEELDSTDYSDTDVDEEDQRQGQLFERGLSASEEEDDDDDEEEASTDSSKSSLESEDEGGDISEQLIIRSEKKKVESLTTEGDHNYSASPRHQPRAIFKIPKEKVGWGKKKVKYKYSFLYSMVVSGVGKQIKNCIPRGVAVLSNSKTIILSHVSTMLNCLDPKLAEICYMDTDSCIFSLTHENIEDNLLPEKKEEWKLLDIIADESGDKTCHGKMKLEGTFKVGLFKALKIYRLFSSSEFEKERKEKTCYTRCKGVNRYIATLIPNSVFDQQRLNQVVVHRSCLRPSRTGEMLIAHECKSLAAPFNLKRHVTSDGLHTFPISFVPDEAMIEDHGNAGDLF